MTRSALSRTPRRRESDRYFLGPEDNLAQPATERMQIAGVRMHSLGSLHVMRGHNEAPQSDAEALSRVTAEEVA